MQPQVAACIVPITAIGESVYACISVCVYKRHLECCQALSEFGSAISLNAFYGSPATDLNSETVWDFDSLPPADTHTQTLIYTHTAVFYTADKRMFVRHAYTQCFLLYKSVAGQPIQSLANHHSDTKFPVNHHRVHSKPSHSNTERQEREVRGRLVTSTFTNYRLNHKDYCKAYL